MRLLLVEDDPVLSRVVQSILKKNNYSCDAVRDGRDAFDVLMQKDAETLYDGVILDLMLPGMDGISVLKALRGAKKCIPVLILSAKSDIDDKVEGLDAGADDYLPKPFDMKEFLARLRALLRKKSDARDSVLRVGNLSLDCSLYRLSTAKGGYDLVGKEYQMMHLFMTHFNTVISVEQMMAKIWETDSEATLNTVWTYIYYIRKKLDMLAADVTVSTKRNLGYVLEFREKADKKED